MAQAGSTSKRVSDGGKLDAIQLLRALAALSVVFVHVLHETGGDEGVLNFGYGVDIFFVISGFIMTHTSLDEFGRPGAPVRFFVRRLARVAPLYWLLTSAMLLGSLVAPSLLNVPAGGAGHILASYLFIPDARGAGEMRPVLALGWTLNYEMFFYVLFSLALLAPARFGLKGIAVLMPLLVVYGASASPSDLRIAFWTNPILLEFLAGVIVAWLYHCGLRVGGGTALGLFALGLLGYVPREAGVDPDLWRATTCGVPAALLLMAATMGPVSARAFRFRHQPPFVQPLSVRTLAGPPHPAVGHLPPRGGKAFIRQAMRFQPTAARFKGRLARWGMALGDASYSLYLVHPFVLRPLRVVWLKTAGAHFDLAFAVFALAGSVAAALLLYRSVERPLSAWLQGRLKRALFAPRVDLAVRRPAPGII